MLKEKLIYLPVGVLAILTAVSGVLLTSDETNAETQSATGKITVETACTLSGTVGSAHTATMLNGTYQQGIGATTLTANCNDENGYSIYAIGFSNDTFGNTNMIGTNGLTFPTGTATSGDTSNWAMRVSAVSGNTTPTIQNGFGNYSAVPTDYTMIASEENATDGTNGSSIQTTYAVYLSGGQGAGTYTGKVKYSLVHPGGGAI
ncbi:MAG: hypothetical protein Q4B29_03030 [Candidatus Saccharibacteria bacterium]|nr:hypothetical protein [Candidatus Saccharibacteria bacterium]